VQIGEKAPEIHITNWIKNQPRSKELSGKFVIIDFWATWCAPCLESVPHMNNLVNKNKSRPNLVFLSITDEKEDRVKELLNRVEFSSTVVSDVTRQTLENFKVKFIPLCVVIDDKNNIQWVGNPAELHNEAISAIMDGKAAPSSSKKEPLSVSEEVDKMYTELTNRYATYFKDQDLKEYFSMTLSLFKKKYSAYFNHTADSYKEIVIGDSLVRRISDFLDISAYQIILPANLATSYISYCYKSQRKTERKQVFNTILNQLNLKYTTTDSLIDIIQFTVSNKDSLEKFISGPLNRIGHTSYSDTYAGIDYQNFSQLAKIVEEKFRKTVVIQQNNIFDNKMSLTIKIDNLENLIASLRSYGIETTLVKKKLPIYRFVQKR
jgi:thiol-disulfide isomerase/thioredoxin